MNSLPMVPSLLMCAAGDLKKVKSKDQAIITCCASGMRSGSAKSFLKGQGYTNVHNGGSWMNLRKYSK